MDTSWKKPQSRMVKPKPAHAPGSEEAADARDEQEALEAQAQREQTAKEREDKIGALIGGNWFIQNWTNPVLVHPSLPQLSVSRFYPDAFVAVDIFVHLGDWEKKLIEYKREQFKAHEVTHAGQTRRVRYGALSWADPLANLLPQLED